MRPEPAVLATGLHKRYGSIQAVKGIDLRVERGEIFAFLGPNGAGKTTTAEVLEGFIPRTSGEVRVLGVDPTDASIEWRDRVGIVMQESTPDPGLTVAESLTLYSGYYTTPLPVDEVLAIVGLSDQSSQRATRLSGGQRRRLDLGLALIGDPELIFLDEPTTGFDPDARQHAWRVIERLRDRGTTIFLTTHYMEEAEHLADRIAVIVNGRIVAEGTPQNLGGRDRAPTKISFSLSHPPGPHLPTLSTGITIEHGTRVVFQSGTPLADLASLAAWSRSTGQHITQLTVRPPSLEDVYLTLTHQAQIGFTDAA
jgi:ABC-2 type transport system ATP-binding protein